MTLSGGGQKQGALGGGQKDNSMELLKAMTPEQRAEWAKAQGTEGVLKLMELQTEVLKTEFSKMAEEERKMYLDAIVSDWAADKQELLQDKELGKVVEGIDIALLQDKGVSSYIQLTPEQLKQHLKDVEKKVELLQKEGGDVKGDKGGKKDEGDKDKNVNRGATHLGDLGSGDGGGGHTKNSPEYLEALAKDPIKFENEIGNLSDRELADMVFKLDNG